MPVYLTSTDLDQRMTAAVVVQIFDDDGNADATLATSDLALDATEETTRDAFIEDGESFVEQWIAATYGDAGLTALRALTTTAPRAVKRLMLDATEIKMGRRHPEYIRGGWTERRRELIEELKMLRVREVTLDTTGAPEPACNEGGIVRSGDPDATTPRDKMFLDGMGDF